MPCACNAGKAKDGSKQYVVKKPNGTTYRTYTNKTEADAAAKRVGGKVTVK